MKKLVLGAAALIALAPRLVYGQVSGFGQDGPASVRVGIAAQAESGMMSLNGALGGEPICDGFTVVDAMAELIRGSVSGKGPQTDPLRLR